MTDEQQYYIDQLAFRMSLETERPIAECRDEIVAKLFPIGPAMHELREAVGGKLDGVDANELVREARHD